MHNKKYENLKKNMWLDNYVHNLQETFYLFCKNALFAIKNFFKNFVDICVCCSYRICARMQYLMHAIGKAGKGAAFSQ